jgi:HAMP domain-containing protein
MSEPNIAARVSELEQRLADLQARLPAHSVPPSMIAELDELEEALARARRQLRLEKKHGTGGD